MRSRRSFRLLLVAVAALVAANLAPAIADVLGPPAPDPLPKVAFVARNDNPADALAVGPVAGALGGVLATTPPTRLSDEAATTLTAFAPEVVYVAGGPAAINAETYEAIDRTGPWETRRLEGVNRDDTARLIATVLEDLGVGRPLVTGGQVVGDAWLGGTLTAEQLLGELDLPPGPLTWSTADRFAEAPPPAIPSEPTSLLTLDVDVPADGVLHLSGSLPVRLSSGASSSENVYVVGTIDATFPADASIAEAIFAIGDFVLLPGSGVTATADGAIPVTAGSYRIDLVANGGANVTADLAQLTVTWTPDGQADAPGIEFETP